MSKSMQLFQLTARRSSAYMPLCALMTAIVCVCLLSAGAIRPGYAAADAILAPKPAAGPSGLPDGRVYEEVSPANKHGNEALPERPAFVAGDGQAVMYGGSGAFGEPVSNSARQPISVSERTRHGWVTRSAHGMPVVGEAETEQYLNGATLDTIMVPSRDLSRLLFGTWAKVPYVASPDEGDLANNVFLAGPDQAEPEWVGRSLIDGSPGGTEFAGGGAEFAEFEVAGVSPDLKTIYFYYEGKLFPGASHLYEYKDGVLSDAGVLPDGETSGGEASPAAQVLTRILGGGGSSRETAPASYDNQVSADGSRIFFTREDEAGKPELYVRTTASDGTQNVELVSQSQLPGQSGEAAPDGPLAVPSTVWNPRQEFIVESGGVESPPSYVFASPDGKFAFFQSVDRLTPQAPENNAAKAYAFDVDTGSLEYLPGLTGSVVTVNADGSSLVFEDTSAAPSSFHLDRWTAGPGGGSVTPIVSLPSVANNACGPVLCVGPASMSADGKVVLFSTESPIAGFNDGGEHYMREERYVGEGINTGYGLWPNTEIFRYDTEGSTLSCLSCPPEGAIPSNDAIISNNSFHSNARGGTGGPVVTDPGRSISPDGNRAFFETRESLVPQDTNGTVDVYEWENGVLYLISSGHSPEPSSLVGVSESSGDAFIMTTEGIAPGDKDGAYDVYDARIPRPGDNPPPEAIPCAGAVCQGPPSVPQLLGQPASETFNGAGNLTSSLEDNGVKAKSLTRAQKLARALLACKNTRNAHRRRQCETRARRKYGAHASSVRRTGNRHHNGRGN